ncbi:MAG: hypothetical protein ACP5QO_08925 [Clostridia bacterium]
MVVTTDHTSMDYWLVADNATLALDTRNALGRLGITDPTHIVKL